jgi:hypothetical protein
MTTPTRPAFTEVPPAIQPSNTLTQAQIRATRSRQATFERGVALALVAGMREQLDRLLTLKEGLRWLIQDNEALEVKSWLQVLQEDIERAERIEERRDRE